tara:strand:- start:2826 stop:3536 length:711 start_codon:yes stop_codon:yes gene_type:complete
MKCLDLFSGTHSVADVLRNEGHEVITLDMDGNSDITINILDWDYTIYPVGYFDYIHASPECTLFSVCSNANLGRRLKRLNMQPLTREILEKEITTIGLPPVYKTLEIIDYFKPKYFTIENPAYSKMKDYIDLSNTIVDYCKYGFPYQKPTRIWNNFNYVGKRCNKDCDFIVETGNSFLHLQNCGNSKCNAKTKNFHLKGIGRGTDKGENIKGGGNNKKDRYKIPPELVKEWLKYMD